MHMRTRKPLLATAMMFLCVATTLAQTAIGEWREHLPYRQAVAVDRSPSKVYCATNAAVFSYDPVTQEVERITKVNALSDVGVRALRWAPGPQLLVVGYENGNVDLIAENTAYNLSDIKRSNILGDKAIYSIEPIGDLAYLSCGFGIVVLDLVRREVRDTWLIGPAGSQVKVNEMAFTADSIYAATEGGLYTAWRFAANLASFTNWQKRPDIPNPDGPFSQVDLFGDDLLVTYRRNVANADTVYLFNGSWFPVWQFNGNSVRSVDVAPNLQIALATSGFVRWTDSDLNQLGFIDLIGTTYMAPAQARFTPDNDLLIADGRNGLVRVVNGGTMPPISPNGPKTSNNVRMSASGGALYVATGSVGSNWGSNFMKDGVFVLQDGFWSACDQTNNTLMATGANAYGGAVNDVMAVAVDPDDAYHAFAGSWDDGLLEFLGRDLVGIYNQNNSTLQVNTDFGADNKVEVAGMAFDEEGNLWVTNSNCSAPISVRKKSGVWKSFSPGGILNNNTLMSDIMVARNGYKWITRPRGQGILVFNDNGTIDNTSDDAYKVITTFEGSGALPSLDVRCVTEDLDDEVWVGTGKGVAVFYSPDAIFSGGDFDAQEILIEQDGNIQVLLETEVVTAILVDGANRKWIGTESSGVYLVSPDGTQQVLSFTQENSPLPSNNITDLAMDGTTGELFIGTDKGIMSYRSDATTGEFQAFCANVFPNPVHPTYTGPIAVTGLVRDSDVRITDISGNLVYSTTSLGGQAIWPGTDLQGARVSTGVYMIFAVDPTGSAKCSTKVLVVR